jgi:hypothetical protein
MSEPIPETLPEVVADYLETVPGQIMLEDAIWFRWSLEERRVTVSGNTNTLTPEQMSVPGTLVFVRDANGWRRYA